MAGKPFPEALGPAMTCGAGASFFNCHMKDAFWFQHDSNARTDARILELRAEMGWEGYGLWWALVEKLREATDYHLSNILIGGLAMDLALSKADARSFLDTCIAVGLLAVEDGCFYAPALRRRMERWDTKRSALSEAGRRGAGKRWAGDKPNDSQAIATPLATPMAITEQNIREEKKEVGKPTPPLRSAGAGKAPEHFEDFWLAYPRKESKATALKAFEKLSQPEQAAAPQAAREWFGRRADWVGPDGTDYRPHPTTWLNQKRWTDLTELTITPLHPQTPFAHGHAQRHAVNTQLVNDDKRNAAFAILASLGI